MVIGYSLRQAFKTKLKKALKNFSLFWFQIKNRVRKRLKANKWSKPKEREY